MKKKVVVVEDEKGVSGLIIYNLTREGFNALVRYEAGPLVGGA